MPERGAWEGTWAIVRFNWPFYVAAIAVLIAALTGLALAPWLLIKIGCAGAVAG